MPGKGLVIASLVLLALAGGAWWANRQPEKPAVDEPPKLITLTEADVQRVEIRRAEAPPTVLERKGGGWQITAPAPLRADTAAVESVISAVTGLTWERLVDEKPADATEYGLKQPSIVVELTGKGGRKHTLEVGDETPTAGAHFARLAGDPRVFTIGSWAKTNLEKGPYELRDKRLLPFDDAKLTRLDLNSVVLSKNDKGDWRIEQPAAVRADGGAVEAVVSKLRDARIESPDSPTGFPGTRVVLARVTDASGTKEMEIRKSGDDYYARSTATEGVYKIGSDVAEGLNKGLADLRNKKIFDFGFNDPKRVHVEQHVFEKSGENWTSGGKKKDSTSVQALIDKLRDLSATSFPQSGFGTPAFDIVVVSNATEKVSFAKTPNGYIAKREGDPVLYGVEAGPVDEIVKAAAEMK
jgi:hypothetical protein